jgi:hypothetical protein
MIILPSICESVADFPVPKSKVAEEKGVPTGVEAEANAEAEALQPYVMIYASIPSNSLNGRPD